MITALSKGQIEDKIAKAATKLYLQTFGVGPEQTRVFILEDMVLIRLKSRLLPIERKLLESQQGISLVKDIRRHIHELTVAATNKIITEITGCKIRSSHSDISTKNGEIFQAYVLDINLEEILTKNKSG